MCLNIAHNKVFYVIKLKGGDDIISDKCMFTVAT